MRIPTPSWPSKHVTFVKPPGTPDASIRGALDERIRRWEQPDLPALDLRSRNDFFLAASALQKAIRRNLVDEAMTYAAALVRTYRKYLSWRLAIIALEDVGHGDVTLVEIALLLASEPGLREELGVERSMVWLAGELARSPGDRAACDLVVAAASHPNHHDVLINMRTNSQLLGAIHRAERTPAQMVRVAASIGELDKRGQFAEALAAVASGLDPRARQIAQLAHSVGLDGLEHGFVAAALLHGTGSSEVSEAALETPKIGIWITPAFDRYPRGGLRAIERFLLRCLPLADLLRVVSPRSRTAAGASLVFGAEGGVMHHRVAYSGTLDLTRWCSEASLANAGAPIEILQQGLAIVREHLPLLNEIRAQTLGERWAGSLDRDR